MSPYNPHLIPGSQNLKETDKEYWLQYYTGYSSPTIESRRNSQGPTRNLEGSSSSQSWEAAYTGPERTEGFEQSTITMSPLLYDRLLKEGHVSELLNYRINIRRESWSHYFVRIFRHLARID